MAPSFLNHVIFRPPPFESYLFRTKLIHLTTAKGNTIVATHIKRSKSAITLIFSHANGDDLNNCYSQMMTLSRTLNVNVIGYDYSGYGKSTGTSYGDPFIQTANALLVWYHIADARHFLRFFQVHQAKRIVTQISKLSLNT